MEFWISLSFLWSFIHSVYAVNCFTCSVDFRSEPYESNHSCLFPRRDSDNARTSCSRDSLFCQGIVTRINGVFVQLQRTCEAECIEYCSEKGFGIETSECRFCCNSSIKDSERCGFQGYKSNTYLIEHCTGLLALYFTLTLLYEHSFTYVKISSF